jgi:DNA-binding response OmpR family regulator
MARHILAVDDDDSICRVLELSLTRAGYRVTTARDGEEALEKVQADRPDLILLDIIMPRMDGFAVLRRLKDDPGTAAIPVLMLTAKGDDTSIIQGWESGVCCYVPKPFDLAELVILVRRFLEETAPAEESAPSNSP